MKPVTLICVLGAVALALLAVVVWQHIEVVSAEQVLDRMAMLQPGRSIAEVKGQLGMQMSVDDAFDGVVRKGSIRDEKFCRGKKLYRFYNTPPCREIDVYTDANDTVVFVTWQQL